MAHYERGHTFIKARDWAVEHIKDNRFGKTSYDRAGQRDKVQRLMENVDRLREESRRDTEICDRKPQHDNRVIRVSQVK